MGKQSSRLYYQGKDHKDIYFQGHYHDAMYVGSELVWEKINETIKRFRLGDVSTNETFGALSSVSMSNNGTISFGCDTFHGNQEYYAVYYMTPNGEIIRSPYIRESYGGFTNLAGLGFSALNYGVMMIPDLNIWKTDVIDTPIRGTVMDAFYINGVIVVRSMIADAPPTNYYDANSWEKLYEDNLDFTETQWFNGVLYAKINNAQYQNEYCYTTDGFNWFPSNVIQGVGTVINNILFMQNGLAFDGNLNPVEYSRKPQFFYNGYYYSKLYNESYIYRSKDLVNWEPYRKLNYKVVLCGYWRQKRLLIVEDDTRNFWQCKINL